MRPLRTTALTAATLGVSLATVVAVPVPASAAQLGFVNTTPGSSAFAADADVVLVDDDHTGRITNIASAENRDCAGCRTGIVAFSLVVVEQDEPVPGTDNVAVAQNVRSPDSFAFADAFQVVITADDAELSDEGRRLLRRLDADLRALVEPFDRGASQADLAAALAPLKDDLRAIADTFADDRDEDEDDEQDSDDD